MDMLVIVLCSEELCDIIWFSPTPSDLPFLLKMITQTKEYALI